MYRIPGAAKRDPIRRWALPDRVFFACGACHILAYAFLEKYPGFGFSPFWIRPAKGFAGNHILVVRRDIAFDYHGYSTWQRLFDHTKSKADRWWSGWTAELVPLPIDVLISEEKSKEYEGLWLRERKQFLYDPLPRAHRFLQQFPAPARAMFRYG